MEQEKINIDRNLPLIPEKVEEDNGKTLHLIASGPSLKKSWHYLLGLDENNVIWTMNGSYNFLLGYGIKPHIMSMLDGRLVNKKFIDNAQKETEFYLNFQVHPEIFDFLKEYDVKTWVCNRKETIDYLKNKKHGVAIDLLGTIGASSIMLAYNLGYRKFNLYGFDCSWEGYQHAFKQTQNENDESIEVNINNRIYKTRYTLVNQFRILRKLVRMYLKQGCEFNIMGSENCLIQELAKT
jgi:hypothetical protein